MITLRGMTWDHDRGYQPLIAASKYFKQKHAEVDIVWDKRSLQAFADRPLDIIAREYDFLIIDHPHVGQASQQESIISLNNTGYDQELEQLAANSMGPSHRSYELNGKQWALAVDAAAQFACYREDLLDTVPGNWDDVLSLAKEGRVLFPLKPVDAVDSFFTLCANMGEPIAQTQQRLFNPVVARKALEIMLSVANHIPKECLSHNPIDTLEWMSVSDQFAYCPLLFGYTNYSREKYRDKKITFTNIPSVNNDGPQGSIIGGTGLAISSQCKYQALALDFAFMVCGKEFQAGLYFENSGQPAHKAAWLSESNNKVANSFFNNTYKTLENSWLRPRYEGFLYFADKSGDIVNDFLAKRMNIDDVLDRLDIEYRDSLLQGSKDYSHE